MIKKILAGLLLALAIYLSFYVLLPNKVSTIDAKANEFSVARALVQLETISKNPHYVGNKEHALVRDYIISELQKLGLETQIQAGYDMSSWGSITKPKNILARIKGSDNSKALMLLSHYDSNPHSSPGASDAGSGVVTILEGVRAFLSAGKIPKNDVIILITDAEELGLNGASLFVNNHPWAKEVGLVLNFEARGSGGPSYMLIETNGGNAKLMKEFVAANPKYPVANSLAYSIYKMLPNDTDLTRFREIGDIDGFNFAFIGDHFDYHTALDTHERLDRNTLEHQASYLMPLLHHFSQVNLSDLKSTEDYIYFNVPFLKTVIYPFSWILPMLFLAIIIFIGLLIYGKRKRQLQAKEVTKGFVAFLTALIVSAAVVYVLWNHFFKSIYPNYAEIYHGFTYNGYVYICAFVLLTIAICFYVYSKVYKAKNTMNLMVAPITIWLLMCLFIAFKLKGASFFIVPVFFALLSFYLLIRERKSNHIVMALLCIPLLVIMSPFIKMLPVGLGLKILYVSAIFIVLIFGLLLPVFGSFKHKKRWSYLSFILAIGVFIYAHTLSGFSKERPKPNSLVYILDADKNEAQWMTYDKTLDPWSSKFLGETPETPAQTKNNGIASKYNSGFTYRSNAEVKALVYPTVEVYKDTIIGDLRHLSVYVESKRTVNRIEVFAPETSLFHEFTINGVSPKKGKGEIYAFQNRNRNRLFGYYVTDNEPLTMKFVVPLDQTTTLEVYEASFDLLENRLFKMPPRSSAMIPKPFVLNDAVVIKKTITIK